MTATQPIQFLMRQQPDGFQEWDLICPHGHVTTEEAQRRYSRAEWVTAWAYWCARLPKSADPVVMVVAIRDMLARLGRERWHCDCDLEPFPVIERDPEANGALLA